MLYTDQEVCYKIFMIHIFLQDTLFLKQPHSRIYRNIYIYVHLGRSWCICNEKSSISFYNFTKLVRCLFHIRIPCVYK